MLVLMSLITLHFLVLSLVLAYAVSEDRSLGVVYIFLHESVCRRLSVMTEKTSKHIYTCSILLTIVFGSNYYYLKIFDGYQNLLSFLSL